MENRCPVCGDEFDGIDSGYSLPMYEGVVDWTSDINFPVCPKCHNNHMNKVFHLKEYELQTLIDDIERISSRVKGLIQTDEDMPWQQLDRNDKLAQVVILLDSSDTLLQLTPAVSEVIIVCAGGCGKTTEGMTEETRSGKFEQAADPECLVPKWTCSDCIGASKVLLTAEALDLMEGVDDVDKCLAVARNQAQHVVEWLKDECDHMPPEPCPRFRCGTCWRVLEDSLNNKSTNDKGGS